MPRVSGPGLAAGRGGGHGAGGKISRGGGVGGGRGHNVTQGQRSSSSSDSSRGGGGRGRGKGSGRQDNEDEEDMFAMAYDPLTGEPLELDGEAPSGKKTGGVSAASMVSPKCEDKVDYDLMVELVDFIMTTEAREAATAAAVAGGGGGRGVGNTGGRSRNGGRGVGAGRGGGHEEPLGAILVFLPGFAEIDQLVRALERHPRIGRGASRVFPLHSSLPSHQQKAIFQRMPPGVRKIVVSTNIAETSVGYIEPCG